MNRRAVMALAAIVPILISCTGEEPSADSLASRAADAAAPAAVADACEAVRSAVEANFPDVQGTYPARVYDAFADDIERARDRAAEAAGPLLGALVASSRETAARIPGQQAAESVVQQTLGGVASTCERVGEPLYG